MRKENIDDLEIDLKELKYLLEGLDKDPMLARAANRLIDLMKQRLDGIQSELTQPIEPATLPVEASPIYTEPIKVVEIIAEEVVVTEEIVVESANYNPDSTATVIPVLGEQLRPAHELSKGLSLNDTFRFSRELFDNDNHLMNRVLQEIGAMHSLADVLSYLPTQITWNEENDATQDFIELLKKYFV